MPAGVRRRDSVTDSPESNGRGGGGAGGGRSGHRQRQDRGPRESEAAASVKDDTTIKNSRGSRSGHRGPACVLTKRSDSIYDRVQQVGEGTYGKVFKSRNKVTGYTAALKRLRMESERDGMPITAIREIRLLQSLRHQNIVKLKEMMIEQGNIYMAFEYLEHDLAGILSHPTHTLSHGNIKHLFKQMLYGLEYLHHKGILHRDIKGSNILLDNKGHLKIADFGLARTIDVTNPNAHYTNRVITLWYRPPELLLGATIYSFAIDVWGMGCILVELFRRRALFQGQDEISQLDAIYNIMGTPTPETWPGMRTLPWYQILLRTDIKPRKFNDICKELKMTPAAQDLASKLLTYDPDSRISAKDALKHEYFSEDPRVERPSFADLGEWHDFEAKQRRRKDRAKTGTKPSTRAPPPASGPTSGPASGPPSGPTSDKASR